MSQQNMKCRVSELGMRLCVISNTCLCLSRQQNWTEPSKVDRVQIPDQIYSCLLTSSYWLHCYMFDS